MVEGGARLRREGRLKPPFRADHVGSLLRPPRLLAAREDFAAGRIDGEGIVSLGTFRSTVFCRKSNASPKIVFETPILPSTCSAAGVNSTSPCSLKNLTAMCPASFVMPSSW